MIKNRKQINVTIIIIVTLIQLLILSKISLDKVEKSQSVITEVEDTKNIRDIDKLLSDFKNCNIIDKKRENNEWIINLKISGTQEEVLSNLKYLDKFIIKNYNITFNNAKYNVDLELKDR